MPEQLDRPLISVCLAAYNGSEFISEQIQSILHQLSHADQFVIVDDASTDNTCEIIESFHDRRIKLIRNATNLGASNAFKHALLQARGNVIFLSDQDDIWDSSKVAGVLEVLSAHPEVDLVISDATLIDRDGARLTGSYYEQRGKFSGGFVSNLIRCKYLGCTMAFRAELLRKALPFPGSGMILHDIWIGTVNRLSGGRTVYIDRPLVRYRRHGGNMTGSRRLSLRRKGVLRAHLLYAAARFWIREHLGAQRGNH